MEIDDEEKRMLKSFSLDEKRRVPCVEIIRKVSTWQSRELFEGLRREGKGIMHAETIHWIILEGDEGKRFLVSDF